MTIAKRVLEYPTQVAAALLVVTAVLSAGMLAEKERVAKRRLGEGDMCEQGRSSAVRVVRSTIFFLGYLIVGIGIAFIFGSRAVYSIFSSDASLVAELSAQDGLMCALSMCTVAAGVASGLAYGAHRFREIGAVTTAALLLVFVPLLWWGVRREGGVTLGLVLAGNLAFSAATLVGNTAVVFALGARVPEPSGTASSTDGKSNEAPLLPQSQ